MSGKKTKRFDLGYNMFRKCPGNPESFSCRGSSPQLINDDETFIGCSFKHTACFKHFTHKSGDTSELQVICPDSGYDGIYNLSEG